MTTPLPTSTRSLLVNTDVAVQVAQYAAGWDLDLYQVDATAYSVTAHVRSVDHAQRLAKLLDVAEVQTYLHRHGDVEQCHTRWRGDYHGTDLHVVTVQRAEAVGQVA